MDTRTGESGGEPAATILDSNTGIATTAGPLAESSTSSSSSSSSSSPSASSSSSAVAPTVILTECTATNAGNLSLTGSSQQQSLHQVHQQQQTRQRVNLIADVAANDVAVARGIKNGHDSPSIRDYGTNGFGETAGKIGVHQHLPAVPEMHLLRI
ncbi:uncharacterized protein [Polyergus mexicanus]|uniref:uncharacterized protein n=1 Tax=Polyergus mexicanus TaxID=615972 RepID=UPI0038B5EDF8